jgi:hypothetical protein
MVEMIMLTPMQPFGIPYCYQVSLLRLVVCRLRVAVITTANDRVTESFRLEKSHITTQLRLREGKPWKNQE